MNFFAKLTKKMLTNLPAMIYNITCARKNTQTVVF